MKKINDKKFSLNRNIISDLNKLNEVKGGQDSGDCWTDILTSIFISCPAPEPSPTPESDVAICTGGLGQCPVI
ncbi:hypothetical protein [Kordia jejudonensis]|uniref:hypothetical protein n=1 Tax=Kordia jejudonensis TaxID=1348245 RepID=UPI0006296E7B|nr:hypothetical protein [Kordia jejudonensis]